jgi:hypothetical protein
MKSMGASAGILRAFSAGEQCCVAVVRAPQQSIETHAVNICERAGQRGVDTPVGARHRFGANVLYIVERRKQHLLPAIFFDQRGGQYDPFISLPGYILKTPNSRAIVPHRKGLKSEDCLEFECMLPPCFRAMPVLAPAFDRHFELIRDHLQQGGEWLFPDSERDTGEAHRAELYGVAQPARGSSVLSDDRQICCAKGVMPDQFRLRLRPTKQILPLCGGQDRTTRHPYSSRKRGFSRTLNPNR